MLQQSGSVVKLAQQQLVFERREPECGLILGDYWGYSDVSRASSPTDRKGMTGAERLIGDITRLEAHAVQSKKPKQNLVWRFSLARLGPIEFQLFRNTGILPVSVTQEHVDVLAPGEYCRAIKRIRISVIGLIPPLEGIRATLRSTGISKIVQSGGGFQEVAITKTPDVVVLTAPYNSSGRFELEEQPELLLPFEGTGVSGRGSSRCVAPQIHLPMTRSPMSGSRSSTPHCSTISTGANWASSEPGSRTRRTGCSATLGLPHPVPQRLR